MAEFSYNPADSISKYFEKASGSIGNVFAHLVEAKRKDNELAEKTYINLEALKKDVNIWGQKAITEEVNNLRKDASGKMFKDGKINHEYLGELTSKVSEIKDKKNFFNLAPELYKAGTENLIANKDNLDSFAAAQRDLTNIMLSGQITNAADLQKRMDKVVEDHTNFNTLGQKAFLSSNPYGTSKYSKTYVDKDGNESVNVEEVKAPKLWAYNKDKNDVLPPEFVPMVNPATGKEEQVPYGKYAAAAIEAASPGYFDRVRAKANYGMNITNEQIAENVVRSIQVDKASVETKDKYQMQSEKAKATTDILEAENKPKEIEQKNRLVESQIAENNAQRLKALSDTGSGSKGVPSLNITPRQIPLVGRDGKRVVGKFQTVYDMTLPKPIAMDFPTIKANNGKGASIGPMKIVSVTKAPNGSFVLNGYPIGKEAMNTGVPAELMPTTSNKIQNIKLSQSEYDSFMNRVIGESKENQASITGGIQNMKVNTVNANSFYGTGQ